MDIIKEWDEFEPEPEEETNVKRDKRGREIINLSDVADDFSSPYDILGFRVVSEKQIYFDGKRGYAKFEYVIQRERDGKYFKFEFNDWGRGEDDMLEQTAYEVERKERIEYFYESKTPLNESIEYIKVQGAAGITGMQKWMIDCAAHNNVKIDIEKEQNF